MVNTQAYLYRWVHIPTGKWYVGSRTKTGCHPNDNYICSSKYVKPMISANRDDWTREILLISNSQFIKDLEAAYLRKVDARNDPQSFNLHNGDGKFTTQGVTLTSTTREKMRIAKIGKCDGEKNNFFGKHHTVESIAKSKRVGAKNGMFGKTGAMHPGSKPKSEKFKEMMSLRMSGDHHPSKDPKNHIICEHCGKSMTVKSNYVRWHGANCKENINVKT